MICLHVLWLSFHLWNNMMRFTEKTVSQYKEHTVFKSWNSASLGSSLARGYMSELCVFVCRQKSCDGPISRSMILSKCLTDSWFQKLILNWNGSKGTEADKNSNQTKSTNYGDPYYVIILYYHLGNTKIFLWEFCSPTPSVCVLCLS
jgi:hypothetical protein